MGNHVVDPSVFEQLLADAVSLVDPDRAMIALPHDGRLLPRHVYVRGQSPAPSFLAVQGAIDEVVRTGAALVVEDATFDPRFGLDHTIIMQGIRNVIVVPCGDGVLYLDAVADPRPGFTPASAETLVHWSRNRVALAK